MVKVLFVFINDHMQFTGHVVMLNPYVVISTLVVLVLLATNPHVGAKSALKLLILIVLMSTGYEIADLLFNLQYSNLEEVVSSGAGEMATSAMYWKLRAEKDTGQSTKNPHLLAARIINSGRPITNKDVNTVLEHQNIFVTEETLDELTSLSSKDFPLTTEGITVVKDTYPKSKSGHKPTWAIYMFINNLTGVTYVGSSYVLGDRLTHYFKPHANTPTDSLRLILQDIRNTGLENFTLRIIELPTQYEDLPLLYSLEQYYILSLNPGNNSLLVVGTSPGGKWLSEANSLTNSVPIHMYQITNPGSAPKLIYVFNSMVGISNNALSALGTKSNTLIEALNSGNPLWNEFLLTRDVPTPEQLDNANLLSLPDLLDLISKVKTNYKISYVRKPAGRPKSTTPPVTIVRNSDNKEFPFDNFNSARAWLLNSTGKNVSNDTIRRRIQSGIPLNGFTYKSNS